ncbi:2'-5' RNA ligase family protein [Thalassobaculum sp.]|uniref:2'-5' RNA ligase family protein n=1 Tax=Thalassobaculum sp. TaxID=2022740 RepID=UPI0032F05C82
MAAGPPPIARPPTRELAFGDPCFAVNLQIRPPDDTRVRLDRLRTRMADGTGLAMQFAPAGTLHLTVFSIVYVRAVYPSGPEAVWAGLRRPVDAALQRLAGTTPPFTLDFVRAGLRGDAVLVEADPDPRLEAIRDRVAAAIAGIAPAFRAPTTHSTLARLAQPVAEPRLRPLSDCLGEQVLAWPVHELRLVVETRYPALEESPAGRYPLTGG